MIAIVVCFLLLIGTVVLLLVSIRKTEAAREAAYREKTELFFKACDALVAFTAELSKVTNDVLNNKR